MKNQTDLIVAIVAFVLTAGSLLGMWLMKRETVALTPPTEVTTTPAVLPAGDVTYANSLPGGGGSVAGMGGMGGMGGGRRGGMSGMGMGGPGAMGPMSMGPGGGGRPGGRPGMGPPGGGKGGD